VDPLCTFFAVVYRTGRGKNLLLFYRWSSRTRRIASPLFYQGARKLMLFAVGYLVFKEHEKKPLIYIGIKSLVSTTIFEKFSYFFQNFYFKLT
jgi:hypothetical protein